MQMTLMHALVVVVVAISYIHKNSKGMDAWLSQYPYYVCYKLQVTSTTVVDVDVVLKHKNTKGMDACASSYIIHYVVRKRK